MAFYAVSTKPLIDDLESIAHGAHERVKQCWFADDSCATGTFGGILSWWSKLEEIGPKYGYFPSPSKCVLIIKDEEKLTQARQLFDQTGINLTTEGSRHLGAVLGSDAFRKEYMKKVEEWINDVNDLAKIARSEPQAAYAAYVFGVQHRWKFFQRTIRDTGEFFEPLEHEIHHNFLKSLTGRVISDFEREVIALQVRFGGLGILKPQEEPSMEYEASIQITEALRNAITHQQEISLLEKENMKKAKIEIKKTKEERTKQKCTNLLENANGDMKRAIESASEKGASSWLSALPIENLGYALNKEEFRDALALRYR